MLKENSLENLSFFLPSSLTCHPVSGWQRPSLDVLYPSIQTRYVYQILSRRVKWTVLSVEIDRQYVEQSSAVQQSNTQESLHLVLDLDHARTNGYV